MSHLFGWLYRIAMLCSVLFLTFNAANAKSLTPIDIDSSQSVISCSLNPNINTQKLSKALQDGSSIRFSWDIIIEELRPYWLNKSIGKIHFNRQATPDLMSKQWLLNHSHSGITHKVASPQTAIQWLSQLQDFPIIDKSLLNPHTSYQVQIKLHIEEGQISEAWWTHILPLGKTIAIGTFSLP